MSNTKKVNYTMNRSNKVLLIIIGLIIISIFLALLLTIHDNKGLNMQAEFNKEISVSPTAFSFLMSPKYVPNNIIEMRGMYSTKYKAPSVVLMTDEPMSIRDLRNIEVHHNSFSGLLNKTDELNASYYEQSLVLLAPIKDDIFGMEIVGEIETSQGNHNGSFFLSGDAIPKYNGEPTVFLRDVNFTNAVNFSMDLLPYNDLIKPAIIMPYNDFSIFTQNNDDMRISQTFKGTWNIEDYYSIYGRPWFTVVTGQPNKFYFANLGVPSEVTIKGDSLSSIKFFGFNGWYKVGDEEEIIHEKGILNWEIKEAKSSTIILKMTSQNPSKVLINIQYQGKADEIILNNINLRSFPVQFKKNLLSIWNMELFLIILAVLLGSFATLIFTEKKDS